jgi:hypothetical protein
MRDQPPKRQSRQTKILLVFGVFGVLAVHSAAFAQPVIRGTVSFKGTPPARKKLIRDSDPKCAASERLAEDVVVTRGKLAGVLVKIKVGTAGVHTPPAEPVLITQSDCMYSPRVVAVMAGQKLAIRNADPTFHNVRGARGERTVFNLAQPAKDPDIIRENLGKPGDIVSLHCDVHPWMQAFVAIVDHPYVAVTGQDGSFEIRGVPPGKYELEAWHPTQGSRSASVTVKGRKAVKANFRY